MKPYTIIFVIISIVFTFTSSKSFAQFQRPLNTEEAYTLNKGEVRFSLGTEFHRGYRTLPVGNEIGNLYEIPDLKISAGLGEIVELQTEYDFKVLKMKSTSKSGSGDLFLWTKVLILNEKEDVPAIGTRFGIKAPTGDEKKFLSTNEADFFVMALLSKKFGTVYTHLNLGLGILGNPNKDSSQYDVFIYGVSTTIPINTLLSIVGEINGRSKSSENKGRSHILLGLRAERLGLLWDLGASLGLTDYSDRWNIKVGTTYKFKAF